MATRALIAVAGFQIIYGIGIGGAQQNTIIAVQTEFADDDVNFVKQLSSDIVLTSLV
jgi:hypothetical protein